MSEPTPAGVRVLPPAVKAWLGPDTAKPAGVEHPETPDAVSQRVRPHWPRLGITRVWDVTGLDVVGVPVATCCRPNARTLSVSQGKGATSDAAYVSALMEAVEFAHAEQPVADVFTDTLAALDAAGGRVVHPDSLPRLRGTRTARSVPLGWMPGVSLIDGGPVAVPADAVRLDHVQRRRGPGAPLEASSNGLAAGMTRAEAVAHGLCELIERDAIARWEHDGARRDNTLDVTTVTDPVCRELLARFMDAELTVEVIDVTTLAGLPVFIAELSPTRPDPFRPLAPAAGAGCHLDAATALRRALTEAAQTRLIDIAAVRDDLDDAHYDQLDASVGHGGTTVRSIGHRPFAAVHSTPTVSTHDDVAAVVGALRPFDTHPVVVDLTDPEIGIPVVKVVAAGLRGLPGMMTGRTA